MVIKGHGYWMMMMTIIIRIEVQNDNHRYDDYDDDDKNDYYDDKGSNLVMDIARMSLNKNQMTMMKSNSTAT